MTGQEFVDMIGRRFAQDGIAFSPELREEVLSEPDNFWVVWLPDRTIIRKNDQIWLDVSIGDRYK